ncbi:MAG: flagellar basal body P-ring formation chaperone FlgA [bacterium]
MNFLRFLSLSAVFTFRLRARIAILVFQILVGSLVLLDCRPVVGQSALKEGLKKTIQQYAEKKLHLTKEELVLEFPNLEQSLRGASTFDQIKVIPARKPIHKGVQRIQCGLLLGGRLKQTLNINVRIRTFQTVVVSKEKLPRLSVLAPEDFALAKLETTSLNGQMFFSIETLSGRRTTRFIKAGEIMTADLVEMLPLITRGNEVNIRFKRGLLEIITAGVARQDGQIGEEIRVKCIENKKIFTAEVLDANTVLVKL